MLLSGASYIYTTRNGKFHVWVELLTELKLSGNEQVLDMGCDRGVILLTFARAGLDLCESYIVGLAFLVWCTLGDDTT